MEGKAKVFYVLILNILIAVAIALTAMYLAVGRIIPQLFLINLAIAYTLAFFIGMFIPVEKIGVGFANMFKVKPGLVFGLLVNVAIDFIYVTILCLAMSFFNVVIMEGQPVIAFVFAFLSLYIPIYIVGYIVSFIFNQPVRTLALKLAKSEQ